MAPHGDTADLGNGGNGLGCLESQGHLPWNLGLWMIYGIYTVYVYIYNIYIIYIYTHIVYIYLYDIYTYIHI